MQRPSADSNDGWLLIERQITPCSTHVNRWFLNYQQRCHDLRNHHCRGRPRSVDASVLGCNTRSRRVTCQRQRPMTSPVTTRVLLEGCHHPAFAPETPPTVTTDQRPTPMSDRPH